jgi:hypothetical protein
VSFFFGGVKRDGQGEAADEGGEKDEKAPTHTKAHTSTYTQAQAKKNKGKEGEIK